MKLVKNLFKTRIGQIFLAFIVSLLMQMSIIQLIAGTSIIKAVILTCTACAFAFVVINVSIVAIRRDSILQNLYFLMILSAFIGPGLWAFKIQFISLFPFRILLFFLCLGLVYVWAKGESLRPFQNPTVAYLISFFFLWLIYGALSFMWVKDLVNGLKDFLSLVSGILIILLTPILLNKKRHFMQFFYIWIFMGLLLNCVGWINVLFKLQLPLSRVYNAPLINRGVPTAVFVNENDFSSFLSITFFLFLAFAYRSEVLWKKIVGFAGCLSSVALIVIASSRANFIALFFGVLVFFILYMKPNERRLLLFGGGIMIPAFSVLFWDRISLFLVGVTAQLKGLFFSTGIESSNEIRMNLLRNTKEFIIDTYGFGVGVGNAEHYMTHYAHYPIIKDINIHNWWAEIFMEYGVFVFIGFVVVFIYIFQQLYYLSKRTQEAQVRMFAEALVPALVCYIFASISPNSFLALNYNWLLLAFCIGLLNQEGFQ